MSRFKFSFGRPFGFVRAALAAGGGGEPAITLAAPTFYDAFTYTDGTRLVAGDPNANAGQVATNPGNLGWTANSTGGPNNARFNPIIFGGGVRVRTANALADNTAPGTYVLSPPSVTQSGDQYITADMKPTGAATATVTLKAVDQTARLRLAQVGNATVTLFTVTGATSTSVVSANGSVTERLMGGVTGQFRTLTDASEFITLIIAGGKAYTRRGPGFPVGPAAGTSFTDPGGAIFGIETWGDRSNGINSLESGPAPTLLILTENYRQWVPKVRASSSAAINTGFGRETFSGTYVGTAPARLQWALVDPETGASVKDWAWVPVADQTIGAGTWSVDLKNIPYGLNGRKAYSVGFRAVDSSDLAQERSAVFGIKWFYVALNIGIAGQSNGAYLSLNLTGNYPDYPGASMYSKADPPSLVQGSYAGSVPYYESTTDGTPDRCFARMGDLLSTYWNAPVAFEMLAISARGAQALGSGGADWSYIQAHHAFAGNAYDMLYITQGENEFISDGANWLANWTANIADYRAMSGQPSGTTIPVFHAFTGRQSSGGTPSLSSTKAMREGQDALASSVADVIPCHHYVGIKMADNLHYSQVLNEGYDDVNRRINLTIQNYYTGTGYDGMGPLATTATRVGAVITVAFDLNGAASMAARNGTDQSLSSSATALTSWEVSADDFATTLTITSAELVGNDVVITLAANPGASVKVRNHYGFNPDVTSWATGLYADGSYIGSKPIITPLVTT